MVLIIDKKSDFKWLDGAWCAMGKEMHQAKWEKSCFIVLIFIDTRKISVRPENENHKIETLRKIQHTENFDKFPQWISKNFRLL